MKSSSSRFTDQHGSRLFFAVSRYNLTGLQKRNRNFTKKKMLVVVVEFAKTDKSGDGAKLSKRATRHRPNQKPQSFNFWRQILQRRGETKKFRNKHNSGKKDNFELRKNIVPREPRPKHSRVAESLPPPQRGHSPMTDRTLSGFRL